jgi:hypothetical protein
MEAELLVTLVEKYEKEYYPIALPEPITAVKEAMEMKGLKDKDLFRLLEVRPLGSQSQASFDHRYDQKPQRASGTPGRSVNNELNGKRR